MLHAHGGSASGGPHSQLADQKLQEQMASPMSHRDPLRATKVFSPAASPNKRGKRSPQTNSASDLDDPTFVDDLSSEAWTFTRSSADLVKAAAERCTLNFTSLTSCRNYTLAFSALLVSSNVSFTLKREFLHVDFSKTRN